MVEEIVDKEGASRGSFHGGDIQGNGCRKMMTQREVIMHKVGDYVIALPDDQKKATDQELQEMLDEHQRLFGHMDGFFSVMRTKRHHLTDELLEKASMHRDHIMGLWRRLKISVTPKVHSIEDHAIYLLEKFGGYGDLGEDAGEKAHQDESKIEARVASIKDLSQKESVKSAYEAMAKKDSVRASVDDLKQRSARTFKRRHQGSAEERENEKRAKRNEGRDLLKDMAVVEGTATTLRDKKKMDMLEDGSANGDSE